MVKVFRFDTSLCKFYINRNMDKNTPINNKLNPELPADSLIASSFGFFLLLSALLLTKHNGVFYFLHVSKAFMIL